MTATTDSVESQSIYTGAYDLDDVEAVTALEARIYRAAKSVCGYSHSRKPLREAMQVQSCYKTAKADGLAQLDALKTGETRLAEAIVVQKSVMMQ